jgi:hypothetical protein
LSEPTRACQEPTLAAGFRRRALFRDALPPIKSGLASLAASDRRLKGCDTLSSSPYVPGRKRRQRDLPAGLAVSRDQPLRTLADGEGRQGRTRVGISGRGSEETNASAPTRHGLPQSAAVRSLDYSASSPDTFHRLGTVYQRPRARPEKWPDAAVDFSP